MPCCLVGKENSDLLHYQGSRLIGGFSTTFVILSAVMKSELPFYSFLRSGVVLRTLTNEDEEARDCALADFRIREAEVRRRQEEEARRRRDQ